MNDQPCSVICPPGIEKRLSLKANIRMHHTLGKNSLPISQTFTSPGICLITICLTESPRGMRLHAGTISRHQQVLSTLQEIAGC